MNTKQVAKLKAFVVELQKATKTAEVALSIAEQGMKIPCNPVRELELVYIAQALLSTEADKTYGSMTTLCAVEMGTQNDAYWSAIEEAGKAHTAACDMDKALTRVREKIAARAYAAIPATRKMGS